MTRDEAKARFHTTTTADEMAELMLDCLKILGPDETESLLIEIRADETGIPYLVPERTLQ